jgi:GNAT superfamily N-acetyltransferase
MAMQTIGLANLERDVPHIRELLLEYLTVGSQRMREVYAMEMGSLEKMVADDLAHLVRFSPPGGRLLLCFVDGRPAGTASLKALSAGMGEIKRMFVRPAFRRQGIGRALLTRLLDEAEQIGYQRLRLDSPIFFEDAHRLYRSLGFVDIGAYEEVEIPKAFHQRWVFMEKALNGKIA